jgi:hypothetical protein
MNVFRFLLTIMLCALFLGCATTRSSITEMHRGWDPWIGQNINNLISVWGTPGRAYKALDEEQTVYSWFYINGSKVSFAYFFAVNMFAESGRIGMGINPEYYYCGVDWTANADGTLLTWNPEGDCSVVTIKNDKNK